MNTGAVMGEAWRAMGVNRLRAALAMLGMVIGVAAVVLMLAIGQGTQTLVNDSIASMGSNLFIILSGSTTSGGLRAGMGSAPTLTVNDAAAIGKLPSIKSSAPVYPNTAQLGYGPNNWSTPVYGVTPDYLEVRNWSVETGRELDDSDIRSAARVAILGKTVAVNLFGDENPLGKSLRIKNSPFTVVGILEEKGQSLDGRDQDDTVMVPITTAQTKLFGNPFPGTVRFIMTQAKSKELMAEAEEDMNQLLRQRHRLRQDMENDFSVRNLAAIAQAASSSAQALSFMLGAIASISLIVGGIGIMNIMLVSVTERTREIGIRMSIGAKRRDILQQFLLEAVFICTLGGLVGAALGVTGAWAVSTLADMPAVVTGSSILVAFLFAAGTGIFFGWYPARKAAYLRPVEALRHE
jgi:putative ABC transport system permease protein